MTCCVQQLTNLHNYDHTPDKQQSWTQIFIQNCIFDSQKQCFDKIKAVWCSTKLYDHSTFIVFAIKNTFFICFFTTYLEFYLCYYKTGNSPKYVKSVLINSASKRFPFQNIPENLDQLDQSEFFRIVLEGRNSDTVSISTSGSQTPDKTF